MGDASSRPTPDEIVADEAFGSKWYYTIELAPDLFTDGYERWAVGQTRALLRRANVESGGRGGSGARCLDIGIQEGMVPVLLGRRGATEVVGYDRILRRARIELVQRALGEEFELVGGFKLADLPRTLEADGREPFDLVVFSGVLYHMFDPLGGLAAVRGTVREGGICIVETSVSYSDEHAMHFNSRGRFAPHALWHVTPACLDYLLRFLRLKPLDVVFLAPDGTGGEPPGGGRLGRLFGRAPQPPALPQGRIAVACRAVAEPAAEPGDEWIGEQGDYRADFAEFLDWERLAADAPEVGYEAPESPHRRGDGSLDLWAAVRSAPPLRLEREQAVLELGARF